MNQAVIIGRLTADPELRNTQSGLAVASFTVAVDRDYKTKGGEKEADFIDCVAWRERGETIAKYFTKGKPIIAQGSIQTRTYEDKQGQKRKVVELVVDRFEFVPADKKAGQAQSRDSVDLPFDF